MGRPRKEKVAKEKIEDQSFVMPTDPAQLKELRDILFEMSGCLQAIKDKREVIKDFALSIEEKFKIPKSVANAMGKTFFKGDYKEVEHKNTIFGEVYSRLFDTDNGDTIPVEINYADDGFVVKENYERFESEVGEKEDYDLFVNEIK